jgi:hypothetical protein
MQLTRRNTLIGLGTIAAGAGVIGGSGAFDSVSADRSFEVSVSGDAAGLLGLTVTNETIAGTETVDGNDIIYFQLDSDETSSGSPAVNEEALTKFYDAFEIANNGSQEVNLSVTLPSNLNGVVFRGNDNDTDLTTNSVALSSGDTLSVDIEIDTRGSNTYQDPASNNSGNAYDITINAESGNN